MLCIRYELIDLVWKGKCFSYLLIINRKLCDALRRCGLVYKYIFWLREIFHPIQSEYGKTAGLLWYHCGDNRRKCIYVRFASHAALGLLLFTHGGNLLIKLWARGTFIGFLTVTSYFRKHQIKILLADLWNWSYNITRAHWLDV